MYKNKKTSSSSASAARTSRPTLTRTKSERNLESNTYKRTLVSRGKRGLSTSRDSSQRPISRWLETRYTPGSIARKRQLDSLEEEVERLAVLRQRLEAELGTKLEPALLQESLGMSFVPNTPHYGRRRSTDSESSLSSTEFTTSSDLSSDVSSSMDLPELGSPVQLPN